MKIFCFDCSVYIYHLMQNSMLILNMCMVLRFILFLRDFWVKNHVFGTVFWVLKVLWANQAGYGENDSSFRISVKNWVKQWTNSWCWLRFLPEKFNWKSHVSELRCFFLRFLLFLSRTMLVLVKIIRSFGISI